KSGHINPFESIDLASLAIELGATFVAQSFSGDKDQLVPLIKVAMAHRGFAFLNVVSPCVTFNNNVGSTKSYDYVRNHMEMTSTMDFVPISREITADYAEGSAQLVTMHDGSQICLRKLDHDWDPLNRISAINAVQIARSKGEVLTGLLYMEAASPDLHDYLKTCDAPLNSLTEKELCPGSAMLDEICNGLR
ncbi:MAG TPA: hypothetical protein PKO33_15045, partial [Pyrinomonadaceae bacterium]|nr:hypothetical protein [Pyrinomonadaceae bacterium]